ncbi:putative F-box protein [Tanacetum coccineum]
MSDYITEDLVVEIFTRLPPKSLIRFKSVSKSLCSRIATPDFIRLNKICSCRIPKKVLLTHRIPHKVDGYYIFYEIFYTLHSEYQLPLSPDHGYDGITPIKFPFPLKSSARAVGSCNGIMLVLDERDSIFWLWNPSIRRKLTIPEYPLREAYISATGFAFDRVTEDYKIVTLSFNHEQNNDIPYSFVYTMKTRTWCQISNPITPSCYETTEGHLVNGVLHWVVRNGMYSKIHRYVMTFDVSTHVFGTIELPAHKGPSVRLTTVNGSLAVITYEEKVMPLSTNGYLLLNSYHGVDVYSDCTRARSRLVKFSDSSSIHDMSGFVESLELLDTGSPYEESKPSVLERKKKAQ